MPRFVHQGNIGVSFVGSSLGPTCLYAPPQLCPGQGLSLMAATTGSTSRSCARLTRMRRPRRCASLARRCVRLNTKSWTRLLTGCSIPPPLIGAVPVAAHLPAAKREYSTSIPPLIVGSPSASPPLLLPLHLCQAIPPPPLLATVFRAQFPLHHCTGGSTPSLGPSAGALAAAAMQR